MVRALVSHQFGLGLNPEGLIFNHFKGSLESIVAESAKQGSLSTLKQANSALLKIFLNEKFINE